MTNRSYLSIGDLLDGITLSSTKTWPGLTLLIEVIDSRKTDP